jgi:type IV pilus assembly protein PilZ
MLDKNSRPSTADFIESSPESANRRGNARFKVELTVSVSSAHNFYQGFAENLSRGGLFVATHQARPVGEDLELSIHLGQDDEPICAMGKVCWVRDFSEHSDVSPGLGVKFTNLSSDDEKKILKFLETREPIFFDDE